MLRENVWSKLVLGSLLSVTFFFGCDRREATEANEPSTPGEGPSAELEEGANEPPSEPSAAVEPDALEEMPVAEVARLVDEKRGVVFDANTESVREKEGVVPNAVLLPSASEYDLSLLPDDKSTPLVFYCANTRCTASDRAAERALKAGYTKAAIMRVGIAGWKEAGQRVEAPPAS